MSHQEFTQVDAFTDRPFAGNPAAVCVLPAARDPEWMQQVAALFPLKWMTQGMRSVFLPDDYQTVEPAGSWEHGRIALVLAAWCVVGLLVAVRTFRWRNKADG